MGLAALAVLVAPAGQPAVVPVVAVSQGPGGGSDGGSGSDGSSSGDVVPNPKHDDTDGTSGGAGSVPEPRRPDPVRPADGGSPVKTPELPRPPGPNRPPERPPVITGSVKAASGPSRPVGDAAAMNGAQILQMDPDTAAALREYLNTRRPEDRRTLDFTTTRVTADEWSRLVEAEGEDPVAFTGVVTELGGPGPFVTQTPLLLRDEQGRFGTATLFRVALTDGGTRMVDAAGLRFADVDDFLESNRFPVTWTMLYPAGIRPEGDAKRLLTVPARTVTVGERLREWADLVARPGTVGDVGPLVVPPGPPLAIGRYQPGREIAAAAAH
jgi:hypothetical protein